MKKFFRKYISHNTWFIVLSTFSMVLITASFILPPLGVIDSSVLVAVGEISGIMAILTVIKAIDNGSSAKVTHNNTSIEIENKED